MDPSSRYEQKVFVSTNKEKSMFMSLLPLEAFLGLRHYFLARRSAIPAPVRSAQHIVLTKHPHFVWERDGDGHLVRRWSK